MLVWGGVCGKLRYLTKIVNDEVASLDGEMRYRGRRCGYRQYVEPDGKWGWLRSIELPNIGVIVVL